MAGRRSGRNDMYEPGTSVHDRSWVLPVLSITIGLIGLAFMILVVRPLRADDHGPTTTPTTEVTPAATAAP